MRATRLLRTAGSSGLLSGPTPKLLLPERSVLEVEKDAIQGWWSLMVDSSSRDAYDTAVKDNIIKDSVLLHAKNGSLLPYSLFYALQNPLFRQFEFDAKEFVEAVGPALGNFHDALARLREALPATLEQEKKEKSEEESSTDDDNRMDQSLGANLWRKQAEEDESSLAGRVSKMMTDACFDQFFYLGKLRVLTRKLVDVSPDFEGSVHVGCEVENVALLSARVMVMDREEKSVTKTAQDVSSEHQATVEDDDNASYYENPNVAAQIDVLYEVKHESSVISKNQGLGKTEEVIPKEDSSSSTSKSAETVSITILAVAVFEGWLHRRPDEKGNHELRWKVSMLREAHEFPEPRTTITSRTTAD
jgi:hypothetical protein